MRFTKNIILNETVEENVMYRNAKEKCSLIFKINNNINYIV